MTAPRAFTRVMASASRHSPSSGVPPASVPRRLAGAGVLTQGSDQGEGLPVGALLSPRHSNQSREVEPLPFSMSDLFRDDDSVGSFEGLPNRREA